MFTCSAIVTSRGLGIADPRIRHPHIIQRSARRDIEVIAHPSIRHPASADGSSRGHATVARRRPVRGIGRRTTAMWKLPWLRRRRIDGSFHS